MKSGILLALGLVLIATTCRADDDVATAKLEEGKALYAERGNPVKLEAALSALATAESEAEDSDLKYDILVLESASLYFKANHSFNDSTKLALYTTAMEKADKAKEVNEDYADAYFWHGANLARWGETTGIPKSLVHLPELVKELGKIDDLKAHDGSEGIAYDSYGANRILGRVYFKIPLAFGGSTSKALRYLTPAYENAKENALNVVYYAEALYSNGQKAKARQVLDEMLAQDPATYNPNRVTETKEEFADARKLRAQMGN
jgi:tetratricopeptide (TPR) repeat protein